MWKPNTKSFDGNICALGEQPQMMTVTPNFNFDGNCSEAIKLYQQGVQRQSELTAPLPGCGPGGF